MNRGQHDADAPENTAVRWNKTSDMENAQDLLPNSPQMTTGEE